MNKSVFKALLQPWVVIAITVIIAVAAVAIAFISGKSRPAAAYVSPTQGPVVEEVDTTGTVKAANSVDLSFQTSGKIAYVRADVGSHVSAGQTLATISAGDLAAQVEIAKAGVAAQQAKLATIQAGATPQSIAVSQTGVVNAQSTLAQAKQGVINAAQDAYVKSDDAIHNKVDQFFNNPRTANPTLSFTLNDSQAQQDLVNRRIQMETTLSQWNSYVQSLPSDPSSIDADSVAKTTNQYLSQVSDYLDVVTAGLTKVIPTTGYPTSVIQGYQSNVAIGHANISAALNAMQAAQTTVKSAQAGLATAQAQLNVTQAPAQATDIAAQQAAIASAQANVDLAEANSAKTVLSAPISGTITVNNAHVGATASPGMPVISMNSDSQFQIETYVSQADLAKVAVGEVATISLDAYENTAPLTGHVITIDPAATVSNGVSSYKVTLQFDSNDPRIQSGLTGNVKITTKVIASGLSVPSSAIITNGSNTFVIKHTAQGDTRVPVTIGVASASGMTQIVSGVAADDQIRTFGNQ